MRPAASRPGGLPTRHQAQTLQAEDGRPSLLWGPEEPLTKEARGGSDSALPPRERLTVHKTCRAFELRFNFPFLIMSIQQSPNIPGKNLI